MKRVLLTTSVVAALAGIGLAFAWRSHDPPALGEPAATSRQLVSRSQLPQDDSAASRLDRDLHVMPDSKRRVGDFELRHGKSLRLVTATTTDGHWCLIDEEGPSGGAGSTCADDGPFARSKVMFSINMDGGPKQFAELYVLGVAAPDIRTVVVSRNDGSSVATRPTAGGGFVVESSPSDLASRVYPTALRLFGRSGKLVETVDIPSVS